MYTEPLTCGTATHLSPFNITVDVVENSDVDLLCAANYYGHWAPNATWFLSNGSIATTGNSTNTTTATFTYTLTASRDDNGAVYTCNMAFGVPPSWAIPPSQSGVEYDTSAPEFTAACSVTLNVLCKYEQLFKDSNTLNDLLVIGIVQSILISLK
jgi:hypothetical protein